MSDLRERLLGQSFAPDDDALFVHVDTAVAVVAQWLRQKAADTRAVADVLPFTTERDAIGAAKMLDALADALTQKEPTP